MNITEPSNDVNPSATLITGRFSQVTGAIFSSVFAPQLNVNYSFSLSPIPAALTLISKSFSRSSHPEKLETAEIVEASYLVDCDTMTATELRERYPSEYTAHRNMKQRSKTKGVPVDPQFEEFRSYLRIMGPRPAPKATVDRIVNDDPEYAPGKVAWADKRTQNSNKGDTLLFRDPSTGEVFTTSRLAALHGVSTSAIRHRRTDGWTDAEIIAGSRYKSPSASSAPVTRPGPSPIPNAARREPESGAAREFRQTADEYHQARAAGEDEPFIPTYEFLVAELFEGNADLFTEEKYEAKFRSEWPKHRPHIDLDRLKKQSPSQVQLIARIDPEYVRQWNSQKKMMLHMAENL